MSGTRCPRPTQAGLSVQPREGIIIELTGSRVMPTWRV